jgi:hypothetical protein
MFVLLVAGNYEAQKVEHSRLAPAVRLLTFIGARFEYRLDHTPPH